MSENGFWDHLPQPIIGLAPMDGVTDAVFRLITARHGRPDLSFTEFTSVDRIVTGHDPDLKDLHYSEVERPVIAQLFGSNPEAFYRAAHLVCELGFDGIDINMGCPSKTIANAGAGAGLIRTPACAKEIIRRTKAGVRDWAEGQAIERLGLPEDAVSTVRRLTTRRLDGGDRSIAQTIRRIIPVSVKTRLGYAQSVVENWMPVLLSEAPAAITLHGRTLVQNYRGNADWEAIARAVENARGSGTLILGNGDIQTADIAVRRIRETGVNGILIGRAAMGNPWIFTVADSIRAAVTSNLPPPPERFVTPAERLALAWEHAGIFELHRGRTAFRVVRKHLSAYCHSFPGASELRHRLVRVETIKELEALLQPVVCA